jgi:acetate kinase
MAHVVTLNAGSSSVKFALFEADNQIPRALATGLAETVGNGRRIRVKLPDGALGHEESWQGGEGFHADAIARILAWREAAFPLARIVAAGHRVVHGGLAFEHPVLVDAGVMHEVETLVPLAPLHQPHNLAPIRSLMRIHPGLPQVACFDTAFHRTQPIEAELFALPRAFYDEGVRRYGFHGLSYEFIARRLSALAPRAADGRTVVAHLGSGVSMCALQQGRSVATTMGFTALDGCPMGTRTGNLDPGVVLYLARERGMSFEAIEDLLYKRSGLLGLSGVSNDMRELEASTEPGARLAIDYFVYRLAREVASLAAAMGGLDAIVFTAGIGENSTMIRSAVCNRLRWLGLELDAAANATGGPCLSLPGSRVEAWRIPTDEERMIAEHALAILNRQ